MSTAFVWKDPALMLAVTPDAVARLEDLFAKGAHAQAEALARSLAQIDPQQPFVSKVLAACVAANGDLAGAISLYRKAPASLQRDWQFHNNFANTLKANSQFAEAAVHYRQAIALHGHSIEPYYNLGVTMIEAGDLTEAERCLRHVLTMNPTHGLTHINLGNILNASSRMKEAEAHYQCAMLTMSGDARLLNNYGQLLNKLHRYAEAEAFYRQSITQDEDFPHPYVNLAELMAAHGLVAEAEVLLRHALTLDPTLVKGHSNLLFVLALRDACKPETLLEAHLAYGEQFELPLKPGWPQHTNTRDTHRTLRIGFTSGDLRDHPVVRYLMPALQQLVQHNDLELYAYSSSVQSDEYTDQYKTLFHHWRDTALIADAELAHRIQNDRIDILIDLSGHSGDNRLLTFARKPAPVQMSWMGYVGTTGLESMDYFVGDKYLTPSSVHSQFVEKILYLPSTTTFQPYEPAIEPNALPALTKGEFTFCSLARINKLNQPTIAMWAKILHSAPSSRMLLSTLSGGGEPERIKGWFAEEGIGAERIVFAHSRTVEEQLRLHLDADLCLDTFPYNGATTIQHALCMGVPTLTLQGAIPGSRLGASINSHVGIPQFIATDNGEYIRKAVEWTQNLPALSDLRQQLPAMFEASSLRQHQIGINVLAAKLRLAWQRWCDGLPPEHF